MNPVLLANCLLENQTIFCHSSLKRLLVFITNLPSLNEIFQRMMAHVFEIISMLWILLKHVKAIDYLFAQQKGCNEIINIGTGKGTSVLDLVKTFERENKIKLNYSFGPRRSGDVIEIYANVDYALSLINWKAKNDIKDAVKDAWNWEKSIRHLK